MHVSRGDGPGRSASLERRAHVAQTNLAAIDDLLRRLRDRELRTHTVLGSSEFDLRSVLTGQDVIEISGSWWFGQVTVIVPEDMEVDVTGTHAFSQQEIRLAPVPRLAGTPEVRVRLNAWFSQVQVESRPPTR